MGGWGSPLHWIIVLVIVLAIFGTKKLRNIGSDLGAAVKGFKEGMKGGSETAENPPAQEPPEQVGHTIEGQAKKEETKT